MHASPNVNVTYVGRMVCPEALRTGKHSSRMMDNLSITSANQERSWPAKCLCRFGWRLRHPGAFPRQTASFHPHKGWPKAWQYRLEMNQLKLGATESIAKYTSRARTLATFLKAAGEAVGDAMLCRQILHGLPEAYDPQVAVLTDNEAALTFSRLMVSLEAREQQLSTQAASGAAYFGKGINRGGRRHHGGGSGGSGSCGSGGARPGVCNLCLKPGHWRRECPGNPNKDKKYDPIIGAAF